MTRLTSTEARAAAASYGWSVLLHDGGGFHAQRGQYGMIVTFAEDGSFHSASVRKGDDGLGMLLPESAVIGELARHGTP